MQLVHMKQLVLVSVGKHEKDDGAETYKNDLLALKMAQDDLRRYLTVQFRHTYALIKSIIAAVLGMLFQQNALPRILP